ncbi:MAG: HEAT repeat domain-containing protein [Cyanobacteria bacterium J06597_1]
MSDRFESLEFEEAEQLTLETAIANLKSTDLGLRFYAAWWMGKFRIDDPEAISLLIAALQDSDDRTEDGGYPLRRNAARALGKMNAVNAVSALVACLDCSDYYVREGAAQSLAMLGDRSCTPALVALLDGGVDAAQMVPGKPHLVQPYDAVLEALGALNASDELEKIQEFLDHPVARVRFASARALYQITEDGQFGDRLIDGLQESELQLRRAALMDLGATNYLLAAPAIAETLAENSLKLIAIKGLLDNHFANDEPVTISDEVGGILKLMDTLL